jgi:hypothetical protein
MSSVGREFVMRDRQQSSPARPNYKSNKQFLVMPKTYAGSRDGRQCDSSYQGQQRVRLRCKRQDTQAKCGEREPVRPSTFREHTYVSLRHTVSITSHSVA